MPVLPIRALMACWRESFTFYHGDCKVCGAALSKREDSESVEYSSGLVAKMLRPAHASLLPEGL